MSNVGDEALALNGGKAERTICPSCRVGAGRFFSEPYLGYVLVCLLALALTEACGGNSRVPKGPPPEYEPTPLMPWKAEQGSGGDRLDALIDGAKEKAAARCGIGLGNHADAGAECPDGSR